MHPGPSDGLLLALVLEMALRKKLKELSKEVRYRDLLLDLSELKTVGVQLGERRYLTHTELVGLFALAFKASRMRPPQRVTEMPCAGQNP